MSNQQSFDFKNRDVWDDVHSVFDAVSLEAENDTDYSKYVLQEIAKEIGRTVINCSESHRNTVIRNCVEIWEEAFDREMVEYMRSCNDWKPIPVERMAEIMECPLHETNEDLVHALKRLSAGLGRKYKVAA